MTEATDVLPISLGMSSSGADRGPGSPAVGAALCDVWTAAARLGAPALIAVALSGEPARRVTALRALRTLPVVPRSFLEPLRARASAIDAPVACRQTNAEGGVYDLVFSLRAETRKVIATFASADDAPSLRSWIDERRDRAICASDPDAAPIAVYARGLVAAQPDDETVACLGACVLDAKTWDTERAAVFDALLPLDLPGVDPLIERALRSDAASACLEALARHPRGSAAPAIEAWAQRLIARGTRPRQPQALAAAARAARAVGIDVATRRRWCDAFAALSLASRPTSSAQRAFDDALAALRRP